MRCFGEPWRTLGEPWNEMTKTMEQIPVPTSDCDWCQEKFIETDRGLGIPDALSENFTYYHVDCFLRTIFGSVGHLQKKCSCYGGDMEDPPEMTLREAATASVKEYEKVSTKDV